MAKIVGNTAFTTGPAGTSGLDSLTYGNGSLWAEYGNGADSTGLSGSSTIVQYSPTGAVEHTFSIRGSVDGLKFDPANGLVWALQNQDGNSTLSLIDPKTDTVSAPLQYAVASGSRGYDDVAYVGNNVYLSYTNPVGAGDAVIQQLTGGQNPQTPIKLTTILADGATGTNISTGQAGQVIPLSDPDSLKSLADGRLILTSGSDNTFAIVTNPGQANQSVRYDTLTNLPAGSSLDDVVIPNAHAGTFYLSNAGTNQIEQISVTGLQANHAYASVGTELVDVNLKTGAQTVLLSGLTGSHGLIFVPAVPAPVVQNEKIFAVGSEAHGTQPDSITVGGGSIWVEYGNGADSTGVKPGFSTIVQYDQIGRELHSYSIRGSIDGLKYESRTGDVWALQNQDGNSTLHLIDPSTKTVSAPLSYDSGYKYGPSSGRGFDDVAFRGNKVFLSESNPAVAGDAVIVQLDNGNAPFGKLVTTPILRFGDTGTNLVTGAVNQMLPTTDPDSLKTLPDGSLVLTSGDNASLIFVHNPGLASQTDSFITLPAGSSGLDDAVMPTSSSGTFIVADTSTNDVLRINVTGLNTHDLYASLSSSHAIVQIDPTTGAVTQIVTGLASPHGLAFLPSATPSASASLTVQLDAAAASIGAAYAALVTPSSVGSAGGVSASPQAGGFVTTHESPLTMPPLTGHASHA